MSADPRLVHYSRKKLDELRPLTYEELTQDRTSGRWADKPDLAAKYVEDRRKFEKDLHKRLAARGITTKPDTSFLYATLSGHERFGVPGQYKHEAELTPELINSSFFDVVGAGKSRTTFGQKGLLAALKKWKEAEKANALKEQEYMGMPIRPRIEFITPNSLKPVSVSGGDLIESLAKEAVDRVRVVLPYEDQYLMETLQNPKWPQNMGKRRFIGGGVDEGETPEQAATRELMEELGAKIDASKFKYLGFDPKETANKLHYLQLDDHGLKPGKYKATVGSDPFIYLNQGLPSGSDYMGADLAKLIRRDTGVKLAAGFGPSMTRRFFIANASKMAPAAAAATLANTQNLAAAAAAAQLASKNKTTSSLLEKLINPHINRTKNTIYNSAEMPRRDFVKAIPAAVSNNIRTVPALGVNEVGRLAGKIGLKNKLKPYIIPGGLLGSTVIPTLGYAFGPHIARMRMPFTSTFGTIKNTLHGNMPDVVDAVEPVLNSSPEVSLSFNGSFSNGNR